MRRAVPVAVALAVVGLVSSGCSGLLQGDAETGNCFETGTVAAFDWDAKVSCDDPHSVEVFAAVAPPPELAAAPRSELSREGSPARELYLRQVSDLCEPVWSAYTGYDELTPQAPEAVVLPALYGEMAVEASPAEQWDSGDKRLVCYQVFGQPGQGGEQALMVEGPVLLDLYTSPAGVPLKVRDCALSPTPVAGERKISCDQPHDREYLGHLNLAEFVDTVPGLDLPFLDRFDSTVATDPDWAVIDAVCSQVFAVMLGTPRPDIPVMGQVFTADPAWGWKKDALYHASCFAQLPVQAARTVIEIGAAPLVAS